MVVFVFTGGLSQKGFYSGDVMFVPVLGGIALSGVSLIAEQSTDVQNLRDVKQSFVNDCCNNRNTTHDDLLSS